MKINWNDLTIPFSESISNDILADWHWLVGNDKVVFIISSIGDLFLRDHQYKIYWLSVGEGAMSTVADSIDEFKIKLQNEQEVSEWFLVDLVAELKAEGKTLKEGEIYLYIKLPVLGGDYCTDNFEVANMKVHFSVAGQIHRQVKDLPPGTPIHKIKFGPEY